MNHIVRALNEVEVYFLSYFFCYPILPAQSHPVCCFIPPSLMTRKHASCRLGKRKKNILYESREKIIKTENEVFLRYLAAVEKKREKKCVEGRDYIMIMRQLSLHVHYYLTNQNKRRCCARAEKNLIGKKPQLSPLI